MVHSDYVLVVFKQTLPVCESTEGDSWNVLGWGGGIPPPSSFFGTVGADFIR